MSPRVALVHDFLLDLRGAERVFAAICDAWPDADVFTAVYDPKGTEGRFAARAPADLVPAAAAADLAHVPAAAAALPARDRVARPARLRRRRLLLERVGARRAGRPRRGARLLLPQPVPLRLVRARGDAARPRAAAAPAAAAAAQPLAPVGLHRRPARRRLRRQLAPDRLARAPLPRARGDRAAPAGGARALRARPGRADRRALPRAGRADGPQAHRRRRARLQPRCGRPLVVVGDGPGAAPAAPDGRRRTFASRAASATSGSRSCSRPRARWSSRRPRSSGSRPSSRSPRAAP